MTMTELGNPEHVRIAIEYLVASGYKITKPRAATAKIEAPKLNALGKPLSPLFDPKYKVRHRTPKLQRAQEGINGISPERWTEMCKLAAANWARSERDGSPLHS